MRNGNPEAWQLGKGGNLMNAKCRVRNTEWRRRDKGMVDSRKLGFGSFYPLFQKGARGI